VLLAGKDNPKLLSISSQETKEEEELKLNRVNLNLKRMRNDNQRIIAN
jgi:hypothetical protein